MQISKHLIMEYLVIALVALLAAGLTFFSGFGLGSLLMPAFALFFPVEIAIAATAVVHLANNIFKVTLVGKYAHYKTVLIFGIPSVVLAFGGALLLNAVSDLPPMEEYRLGNKTFTMEYVKVTIALLMIVFGIMEVNKKYQDFKINRKYLPLGGALSGFFGGLSGHQGALRAAFLIKSGLKKEQFIGTSVVISVMVDITRIIIYGTTFVTRDFHIFSKTNLRWVVLSGIIAAFIGTFVGSRLIKKVTLRFVKYFVGTLLLVMAIALSLGIV